MYVIQRTDAKEITEKLVTLFATLGKPLQIISDNGPQFTSQVFKDFCKEWGIVHRLVTPYHPQSNGEVERFFRTVMKIVKIAMAKQENWRVALEKFLLSYRTTPHTTTNVSPAEMLLGRNTTTKLPEVQRQDTVSEDVKRRDAEMKEKQRRHAGRSQPPQQFKPGDVVN